MTKTALKDLSNMLGRVLNLHSLCPEGCIIEEQEQCVIDQSRCTSCGECQPVCPVDCIYEGEDQYYIHPEECIDCGACVPECPVEAIFPDDEVPAQWTEYIEKNYVHFDVPLP